MARRPSWFPLLGTIRKRLQNSAVTYYCVGDLKDMFEVKERQAQELMGLMPTVRMGTSWWVEREPLLRFVEECQAAGLKELPALFARRRTQKQTASRRKPRAIVRREFETIPAEALGEWMARGRMLVEFERVEELADVLFRVAVSVQEDLEAFIALYEPARPMDPEQAREREEAAELRERSRALEKVKTCDDLAEWKAKYEPEAVHG